MRATHEKDSAGNETVAFFQQINKLIIIFTLFMLYLHCYRNAIDFTKQVIYKLSTCLLANENNSFGRTVVQKQNKNKDKTRRKII